ncbi:MAG: hypothetical protein ACE5IP_05375 [Terriglobia bacterium]
MKRVFWVVVVSLALALSLPVAAAQGRGKGKGKSGTRGASAEKSGRTKSRTRAAEKSKKGEEERERHAAQGRAIGKDQEKKIREWFGHKKNLEGLPPGLAKRDELPPGLERHLEKNGTLPPGLQKRIQPLPQDLERQLPKTPKGVKRVVVAGNVILLEERTSKVLDIVKDVTGDGSRRRSRKRTGVERVKN